MKNKKKNIYRIYSQKRKWKKIEDFWHSLCGTVTNTDARAWTGAEGCHGATSRKHRLTGTSNASFYENNVTFTNHSGFFRSWRVSYLCIL